MLHDRVLVRQDGAEGERRSSAGIVIPATASVGRRLSWATAVGVGPSVRSISRRRPGPVRPGRPLRGRTARPRLRSAPRARRPRRRRLPRRVRRHRPLPLSPRYPARGAAPGGPASHSTRVCRSARPLARGRWGGAAWHDGSAVRYRSVHGAASVDCARWRVLRHRSRARLRSTARARPATGREDRRQARGADCHGERARPPATEARRRHALMSSRRTARPSIARRKPDRRRRLDLGHGEGSAGADDDRARRRERRRLGSCIPAGGWPVSRAVWR